LSIDESLHSFHLPTLALQVVVENCFKHNSMTSKMPLRIDVSNTDDHYIVVRNNIQPKIGGEDPSGYGLELLKKRYELMNIQKGVLVEETPDQFSVQLKLIR
jgi:two-component system LytT family sensor kinase